jgi:four helix bundle protein
MRVALFACAPRYREDRLHEFSATSCCGAEPSIGANYREAMRSRSKAEFIAKLGDSLKETSESEYWLELLSDESFLPVNRLQPLLEETREITAMLIASIKTARSR